MSKVLITDYAWDSLDREAAVLEAIGAELVVADSGDESELVELVADADAILTCFAQVTRAVIRAGTRLRVIGRYGIGVDNIAVDEATALGIPVTNVPDYCVDEVAEHTLAFLLALARSITEYDRGIRRGSWGLEAGRPMHRLSGQTLGLVGFGAIAQGVAARATALGLRVIATTRSVPRADLIALGVEHVSLSELAAQSDFVSLHVPHTLETDRLIDAAFLSSMKPGAYLINTARGGILDQKALLSALQSGQLGGAALDVFTPERIRSDDPLLTHPRVIATPHAAFYSEESIAQLAARAAGNVARVLAGWKATDTVNPYVYDLPRWNRIDDGAVRQ